MFWKIDDATRKPRPSIIHAPFRPDRLPLEPVQNTDPMVFGDAVIYSNCLQHAYASLRTLAAGSIVLFGRHSREARQPSFSLDTCLVIDRVEALGPLPFDAETYGEDILTDAVLSPLYTEGAVGDLAVYSGRMRAVEDGSPFSFFPARRFDDPDPLFARPQIVPTGPLEGVISPENMQGIKGATVSPAERDAIWQEVTRQVVAHGCALGYRAVPPPLAASHAVEAAALRAPAPLPGELDTAVGGGKTGKNHSGIARRPDLPQDLA